MPNPNLAFLQNVYGETSTVLNVLTTPTVILSNANNSGVLLKVNSLYVTNLHDNLVVKATVDLFNSNTNTLLSYFSKNLTLGVGATVNIITVETPVYLTENLSIRITAEYATALSGIVSYERIS
jgi:hypothetical protein